MAKYKYITEIEIKALNSTTVIPCINEDGFRTILIKNSISNEFTSLYSTKYLNIKKNAKLTYESYNYFCHIISCKESTEFMNKSFDIMYEYLFKKIEIPIDEIQFSEIIYSIEELFSRATSDSLNIQIGTAGELLTLIFLHQKGYHNIFDYYHKNSFSKHDIEINERFKIEVKTSVSEKRIHRFSHLQLVNDQYEIFISSVLLSLTEKGMTMLDLIEKSLLYCNNFESTFNIKKLLNYMQLDEYNKGIIFSFENSIENIKFYPITSVPKIIGALPKGITNLSYDVILDYLKGIDLDLPL